MKIVKRGIPKSSTVWSGDCKNCDSVIEALESELPYIEHDQRENSRFSRMVCPVCYNSFILYPTSQRREKL